MGVRDPLKASNKKANKLEKAMWKLMHSGNRVASLINQRLKEKVYLKT